jgi:putative membrane protein
MLLFMVLFAAGAVIGFVYLVRALAAGTASGQQEAPRPRREDAREVLRRRYAAGDIDREEFIRRRQDLDEDV